MEVRKLGLNARASCKPVRRESSTHPCGARRSPSRSRRRGTQANADVAGFVPSRSGSGSQVSALRYAVLMPSHSTTSSRCGAVFLRHSNIRCRRLSWVIRVAFDISAACAIRPISDLQFGVANTEIGVIQAPEPGPRIMRYELTDFEWTAIRPFLPNKPRGVPRVNDRRVLNGIFWILRSGAPWRDLPESFGPYTTCYNRFVRWRMAGNWDLIMEALAETHNGSVQMIDFHCPRPSARRLRGRGETRLMGRSRGGLTTKIHACVDTNGMPVRLELTTGEAHDNRLVTELLTDLKSGAMLLADRGYDADWIRAFAGEHGAWANIPPKRNRKDPICFSPYLYRARNLVERFFNRIKQCRRVATRYDKLAANYLAFIKLAAIRIWLRAYESTP
jgi:transposase